MFRHISTNMFCELYVALLTVQLRKFVPSFLFLVNLTKPIPTFNELWTHNLIGRLVGQASTLCTFSSLLKPKEIIILCPQREQRDVENRRTMLHREWFHANQSMASSPVHCLL